MSAFIRTHKKHISVFIPVNKMHPQLSIKEQTATL